MSLLQNAYIPAQPSSSTATSTLGPPSSDPYASSSASSAQTQLNRSEVQSRQVSNPSAATATASSSSSSSTFPLQPSPYDPDQQPTSRPRSPKLPPNSPTSPISRYMPFRSVSGAGSPTRGGFALGVSPGMIVRGMGTRLVRISRRGNLPFLIVFISCVLIFFSALLGIGYVDPDTLNVDVGPGEFMPGIPVFDLSPEQARHARMEEQRELEQQWMRKKRPNAGAWIQKQRDDKAVRRRPAHKALAEAIEVPNVDEPAEFAEAADEDGDGGLRRRELATDELIEEEVEAERLD